MKNIGFITAEEVINNAVMMTVYRKKKIVIQIAPVGSRKQHLQLMFSLILTLNKLLPDGII